jgi:hypothetical protein
MEQAMEQQQDSLVDYAYPCMMAEKSLKDAHDSMLCRDYDAAIEQTLKALADTRLMLQSIRYQKEVNQ